MRVLVLLLALSGPVALAACQRWGPNNPPRHSDNPQLQMLRDSRRNGLRTRCMACHGLAAPDAVVPSPSAR